jgi:Fur family iron response transcriptional regulator
MSSMDRKLFTRPASDEASDTVNGAEAYVNPLPARLIAAGLRPTRQRVALGELLFGRGDRHVTAERLFEEATAARLSVSLATVYNTLHQFTAAGILREIAVDGARVYFDTNTSEHHHFLLEDDGELYDIPGCAMAGLDLPEPPEGLKVARIDVVVRLRREASA